VLWLHLHAVQAQSFYFGADLSYVNEMEACGTVYTENGEAKDPYRIFKQHGCNLVRLRTWHTPSWYDQLNDGHRYGDLNDIRISIARAKADSMDVLLDFHLSDTWADPSHQVIPAAWNAVVDNQPVLGDSLYNYILHTLTVLGNEGLLPELVQIGNETNKGILLSQEVNDGGWTLLWSRNAFLFQKAADAIHAAEVAFGKDIKIALHIADPIDVHWMIGQFVNNGFTDFDIIGMSYYWEWHMPITIQQTGLIIEALRNDFPGKEVMIFETAYPWTTQNADAANNLLFRSHSSYNPLSPENQKKWMTDLAQTVIDYGGLGVVYCEPAWVSTNCETQWVTGSSWDNATFFNALDNLINDGGIGWMTHPYEFTTSTVSPLASKQDIETYYDGNNLVIKYSDQFSIYPPVKYQLFTADGKLFRAGNINPIAEDDIYISIRDLVSGYYILQLIGQKGETWPGKVVVVSE
jgi:arabinogalactan endo-1,4-beta-galactosidase